MLGYVHVDIQQNYAILYNNILLNFKAQYLELQSEAHPIIYIRSECMERSIILLHLEKI